jgi:hypothetical protein
MSVSLSSILRVNIPVPAQTSPGRPPEISEKYLFVIYLQSLGMSQTRSSPA